MKVIQLCPTLCNPLEFSRPEYWVGSLSLLRGIFPTQELKNHWIVWFKRLNFILYELHSIKMVYSFCNCNSIENAYRIFICKRVLFVHMVWSRVKKLYWVKFGKHCIKTLIEIFSRLWGDVRFFFLQLKKIQFFYYKHVFLASLTQWTWVGANSGRQWRTGKPGVLPSMGSQRVGHDWATEQQQHFLMRKISF